MTLKRKKLLDKTQIERAWAWYKCFAIGVDERINQTDACYPPRDPYDKNNPGSWIPAHWKWFLQKYGL